ncbi:MAG TPA: alpha/beta hydrolase [Actinomycetota bacterium]|nr:alpha/beta hydrolase [Actinomycetota bacterium]
MSRRELGAGLWAEDGGRDRDAPTLVLLHGLGATGEVWAGLRGPLDRRWPGRWLVPDLRGHGRSSHAAAYSFGQHAADVAALLRPGERVVVLGHSMGGVVGIALASGWFGVGVAGVVGIGVKVSWTDAELARAADLAHRPVRRFEHRDEAAARFLRVAGLEGLAAPDSELVASGLASGDQGWRLAADPATAGVGAPDMAGLLAAARAPVRLARGESDGLVTLAELRRLDPGAVELTGLGHNAHVEAPEQVLELAEQLLDA